MIKRRAPAATVERAPAAPTRSLPASAAGPLALAPAFRDLLDAAAETVLARHRDALAPNHPSPDAAALRARRRRTQASPPLAARAVPARVFLDVSSLNSPPAAERTAGGAFSEGRP